MRRPLAPWLLAAIGVLLASPSVAQEIQRREHAASVRVLPGSPAHVAGAGAFLQIEAGTVSEPTDVVIDALDATEVADLDPGMTNVTGSEAQGYRFGPHGSHFLRSLVLTLPYDARLLPPGMTHADVRAFYLDEAAGRWVALERANVDARTHTVVSLTDHFTDIILATLAVPSHPGVESFVPSMMRDMKAADPGDGLELIAPPQSNPLGDAKVAYAIDLPPGRNDLQPALSLQYSSQAGDGWIGLGWGLSLPQLEVETRWGVPRYSVVQDGSGNVAASDLETESYLLDGLALTPVTNRAAFARRSGDIKAFHSRVEGTFERIIRHGTSPTEFWWEVTGKDGVRSVYGEAPELGVGPGALRDDAGHVFRWALREVQDAHGNAMRFQYELVSDVGVPGGSVAGRQLYLRSIDYTGRSSPGGGYEPGAYVVRFIRDSDAGITSRVNRRDVVIDCRGGFKQVTADLLRAIRVELDGDLIRQYDLVYDEGPFGRTRLRSVSLRGTNGEAFPGSEHRFSYFDDVSLGSNGYQTGFAAPSAWTVPFDDLNLCDDLGPVNTCPSDLASDANIDRATALGGAISHSIGGHLYLGLNCGLPAKQNSFGGKVGHDHSRTRVLSALMDVNGDNLPDKVFRSGTGFVYRANESRPGGQPAFSNVTQPLIGIDEISEETIGNTNGGPEGYPGGVSIVVNVSGGQSLGTTYATDANGDGLLDFVRDGNVLFGHLRSDGAPVFETTSAHTPLPIASGSADGGGLIPDYEPQFQDQLDEHPLVDVFRRWTAPFDGFVRIGGEVRLASPSSSEDGVRVSIQQNGAVLWAAELPKGDTRAHDPQGVERLAVVRGDHFYFRVQSVFEGTGDAVDWDPEIQYLDLASAPDANGLDARRYRASENFVLAGRAGRARMPNSGHVRLTGVFQKPDTTSDDIAVAVQRNDTEIYRAAVPWDSTGEVSLDLAFDVVGDDTSTSDTDEADRIAVRLLVDSPIDAARIGWRADTPPELVYESAAGASLRTLAGEPLVRILVPSDMDLYPADGLSAPQAAWGAPRDGTVRVESVLGGEWSFRHLDVEDPVRDGELSFTVKRAGARLAKRTLPVQAGHVTNAALTGIAVAQGDSLFVDYSVRDASARGSVAARIRYDDAQGSSTEDAPCALHSNIDFDDVSALGRGLFGQPYRGWTFAGYNGNPDRGDPERPQACFQPRVSSTLPIRESDLVLSDSLSQAAAMRAAASPDANAPPPPRVFAMSPVFERLTDGTLRASWRGPEQESWVQAGGSSSTRLGVALVGVPCASDVGGDPGTDHRAVPRIAGNLNVGAGVAFIAGSVGRSNSDLDFLDMNGDQFPDLVGHERIQYTLPDGGLEPKTRSESALDTLRRSLNVAGSVSLGGTVPTSKGGSRGTVGSNDASAPRGERQQGLMPALGISGELGGGVSTVRADLVDVNGDGLPDRALHDGTVALNLGYSFAAPEAWPGFTGLDQSNNLEITLGAGLGYNDLDFGWAGGLSLASASSKTHRALLDLNGDGLPDQLRRDGTTLWAAFNSGNQFLPEVRWLGTDVDQLAMTASTSIGGGAFITIPVPIFMCSPVTVLFLIINPGGMVAGSIAKQERALVDVDGDRCADFVSSSRDDELIVASNRTGRTNLLQRVDRPLRGSITLDYARQGNTPDLPQSTWALSRVELRDGVEDDGPSPLLTTYRYEAPRYDRGEREFYGFQRVTEEHRSAESPDRVVREVTRTFRNDSYYSKGLITSETTSDGAGQPFRGSDFHYEFRDVATQGPASSLASHTATLFPMLTRSETRVHEGSAARNAGTQREYTYDPLGNVVHVSDAGDPGPGDDLEATITYADCPDGVRSRPNHIVVTGPQGTLAEREADVECATGDVREIREKLADGSAAVTELTYFPSGLLESLTGPANLHGQRDRWHYEYDARLATHLARIEDDFGLVSSSTHDLRFGRTLRTTDANGNETSYEYDAFGRLSSVTGPYDQASGHASLELDYHPEARIAWAHTRHFDVARGLADPIETYLFTDGLGRVLQAKVDGTVHESASQPARDVMIVSGRTRFDGLGRAVEQFQPVTEPLGSGSTFNGAFDATPPSRVEYDVLDRPIRSTLPDLATTTFAYGIAPGRDATPMRETTIEDADGRRRRLYLDTNGDIAAVREGAASNLWTSYDRDPLSRLIRITDAAGHQTRIEYDQLGRRTRLLRPDAGETRYTWDMASNLIALQSARHLAKGGAIRYDYDHTRRTAIVHEGALLDDDDHGDDHGDHRRRKPATDDVTFTYGPAGGEPNAAGRLVRVTDAAGVESLSYGRLGEVVRRERTFTRVAHGDDDRPRTYATQYRYDTWGRLLELTNPDGEQIRYAYDSGGLVDAVAGSCRGRERAYVTRLEYDKFRQQAFLELGNGVQTEFAYRADNQRLDRLTSRSTRGVFQDLHYGYDPVGNLLNLENAVPVASRSKLGGPTTQTFEYDDLHRLARAFGSYRPESDEREEYELALTYDDLGNILRNTRNHVRIEESHRPKRIGKSSFDVGYTYDPGRPHAPVRIGDRKFTFDESGNQTGWRTAHDGQRQKVVWDAEDRARSISEQGEETRFTYDANGARILKDGEEGQIAYVSPFYSVRNGKIATTHILVGGTRVASRVSRGDEDDAHGSSDDRDPVYYIHPDHLGSVHFVTDAKGTVVEHLEYFPFGERWVDEERGSVPVETAFSGREQDEETGLLYFGARYHDPRVGQFLSVDPSSSGEPAQLAGASPAALNIYAFASNNPIRLTSPAGMAPGWWSRMSETFALERGVGGSLTGDPDGTPEIARGGDGIANGAASGPAGDFIAGAGTGAIHDLPETERKVGARIAPPVTRSRSNAVVRGPPPSKPSAGSPEPEAVTTRERSNAVVGEGPSAYLGRRAPVILGENMAGRVTPYARSVGAETIVDWLAGRKWTQELNDEYIRTLMAENREIIDIGPDFGRRLQFKLNPPTDRSARPVYETERQILGRYWNRRQVYIRTGKYQGGVPGLDRVGKLEGGVTGMP